MPLVGLTPTKARLVIEENKESVLVMKVTLAKGESVALVTGGTLHGLAGVLRVRERRADGWRGNGKGVGSLVFVDAARSGEDSAKFQINISMSARKFDALLKLAISGRLPSKLFIDAGEKTSRASMQGMGYGKGPEGRTKIWDNKSFRSLLVTNFVVILPITLAEAPARLLVGPDRQAIESVASNAQVAELADDIAVFRSETHHTLIAVLLLFVVTAIAAILFNIVQFFR